MLSARIVDLGAVTDLHPLAALITDVWPGHYGPGGAGNALNDLDRRANGDGLPIGVAAFLGDQVIGTAALTCGPSFGAKSDEGPWLIGLAVARDQRRQGLGRRLVAATEARAVQMGCAEIYATTRDAESLMLAQGWHRLRQVEDANGQPWQVLHRPLT